MPAGATLLLSWMATWGAFSAKPSRGWGTTQGTYSCLKLQCVVAGVLLSLNLAAQAMVAEALQAAHGAQTEDFEIMLKRGGEERPDQNW